MDVIIRILETLAAAYAALALHAFIGVSLHEAGHYIAARFYGFEIERVVVGAGPRVASARVGGAPFELRLLPFSGAVYVFHLERPRLWPFIVFTAAGAMMNLLLIVAFTAALFAAAPTSAAQALMEPRGFWEREFLAIGIATNVVLLVSVLAPTRARVGGVTAPSDGLFIWRLLFRREEEPLTWPEALRLMMRGFVGPAARETFAPDALSGEGPPSRALYRAARAYLYEPADAGAETLGALRRFSDDPALSAFERAFALFLLIQSEVLAQETVDAPDPDRRKRVRALSETLRALAPQARGVRLWWAAVLAEDGAHAEALAVIAAMRAEAAVAGETDDGRFAQSDMERGHPIMLAITEGGIRLASGDLAGAQAAVDDARMMIRRERLSDFKQDLRPLETALRQARRAGSRSPG